MINGKIELSCILKYNMSNSGNAFPFPSLSTSPLSLKITMDFSTGWHFTTFKIIHHADMPIMVQSPILPNTFTNHSCEIDWFFYSISIHSFNLYLCPLPKLECRVKKFNYSMLSIYLNLFQLLPWFAFMFYLRKIPTCKIYHVTLYLKPFNNFSSPVKIPLYALTFYLALTSCLGSSPLRVIQRALISLLLLQKSSLFLPLDLALMASFSWMFIFLMSATLPLSLCLVLHVILLSSLHLCLSYTTDAYWGLSDNFSNSTYCHLKYYIQDIYVNA